MSNTLSLNSVDLTSSVRTSPLNGTPSSADYNETQRENLVDLSALAGVINNLLIPYFSVLSSASAGSPPVGIEGRTIFSDSSDSSDIFYNAAESIPLDIASSMRLLRAMITVIQTNITQLNVGVQSVQSSVSAAGITNLTNVVQQLRTLYNTLNGIVTEHTIELQRFAGLQGVRVMSNSITPGSIVSTNVIWPTPYVDDNYTVTLGLESGYGVLQIISFTKLSDHTGIQVLISNSDPLRTLQGKIHASAEHD